MLNTHTTRGAHATRARITCRRESCNPQDREGVGREPSPRALGKALDLDGAGRQGHASEDLPILHRDVGNAEVVAELVLAGEAKEEAIEIGLSAGEGTSVVVRA